MTPNRSAQGLFSTGPSGGGPHDSPDDLDCGRSGDAVRDELARSVDLLYTTASRLQEVEQIAAELRSIDQDRLAGNADGDELAQRCIDAWQRIRAIANPLDAGGKPG